MKRIIILVLVLIPAGLAVAQQFGGRDPSGRTRRNGTSGRTGGFNRGPMASAADAQATPAIDPRNLQPHLPETYLVLSTRSIFARDGRPGTFGAPAGPQAQWAFRGAALQDGRYIAFLEDTVTHTVSSVADGQSIAGGQIAQISLDSLSYVRDERKTAVRIGQNLAGYAAPAVDGLQPSFAGQAGGRSDAYMGRGGRGGPGGATDTRRGGRGMNSGGGRPSRGSTVSTPAATPVANGGKTPSQGNDEGKPADNEEVAEADPVRDGGPGFDGPEGPEFDGGPLDFGRGPGFDPGPGPGGPPGGGPPGAEPGGPPVSPDGPQ